MKKYFFTMMTTAMLFASCSSDETVAPNNGTENQEDLVEIKLGTSSRIGTTVTESRAAVENDWENIGQVGIFALDKESAADNLWDATLGSGDNKPIILWNTSATIDLTTPPANPATDPVAITLAETKYYPRQKGRAYNFYGYHPYIDGAAAENDAKDGVVITGTNFTGQEDIMFGIATNTDATAYSAEYFRTIAKNAEESSANPVEAMANARPNIEFNHLTSRLKVYLVQGYDYDETNTLCQIKDITVELPTNYTLTFDKNTDNAEDAVLEFSGTPAPQSLVLASALTNGHITTDKTTYTDPSTELDKIGDILVPPTTVGEGYEFSIEWNENNEISPINIVLKDDDSDPNNGPKFEAGKAYNIIIKINGPKEIEITATLAEWQDGGNFEFEI